MPGIPRERVYAIVRRIPRGRVATYGQVARIAGLGAHARQVGYALAALRPGSRVPWHRVINARGEVSRRARPGAELSQRMLARARRAPLRHARPGTAHPGPMAAARVSPGLALRTARLVLRPLDGRDADALLALAGAFEIADTTATIPHPYLPEHARMFLALDAAERAAGGAARFAVRHDGGELVGVAGLHRIDRDQLSAELGYWIGVPWWGRGYATEAAAAVVRHGFDELGLHKIHAHYLARNPASGKVLERIGMRREGLLREEVRKWDRYEDVVVCGVIRSDPRA